MSKMSNRDIEVRNEFRNAAALTDAHERYQARMLKLRQNHEENIRNHKFTPGHGMSADETKAYIRSRLKEAKWVTKGPATVNDFMLWAVITLLTLSVGGLLYIGYLVTQLGG